MKIGREKESPWHNETGGFLFSCALETHENFQRYSKRESMYHIFAFLAVYF